MSQFKNATITTFNKDLVERSSDDWVTFCEEATIGALVFQLEKCPETQRKHLQGYCEIPKRKRIAGWKKLFKDKTMHLEKRMGTQQQAIVYCNKSKTALEGTQFTWGVFRIDHSGHRKDLEECYQMMKDPSINEREIADLYPGTWTRYHKAFRERRRMEISHTTKELESNKFNQPLRLWQMKLRQLLMRKCDDRSIMWITDLKGGHGKTWFAQWCEHYMDAQLLQNGSTKDIAMAYKSKPLVFINLQRCPEEFINYSVMENIKDCRIWAPKYQSKMLWTRPCHLVVLANQDPDLHKVSADRWNLWILHEGELIKKPYPMFRVKPSDMDTSMECDESTDYKVPMNPW